MGERILVYNKGGTIASRVENGSDPIGMTGEEMVDKLPPSLQREIEPIFVNAPVENSSNISVEEVIEAAQTIFEHRDKVSTAVMLIGANTLLQVAAGENLASGRYFPWTRVWCAAQLPVDARGSDALNKWAQAFEVALSSINEHAVESLVVNGNDTVGRTTVSRRTTARGFHMFDSEILPPVATINGDGVTFADFARRRSYSKAARDLELKASFYNGGIHTIELFIGYDPNLDLIPGIEAGKYGLIIARGYEPKNSPDVLLPALD